MRPTTGSLPMKTDCFDLAETACHDGTASDALFTTSATTSAMTSAPLLA